MATPATTHAPTSVTTDQPAREHAPADQAGATRSTRAAVLELAKPRITRLVVITTGVGFALAAVGQAWHPLELAWRLALCLIGTAFSSAGANALNQWWERDRDALMRRTRLRPLPAGELTPRAALLAGLVFSFVGLAILAVVGLVPAVISLLTIASYVLVYTPMKPLTPLNTLVGAVPGALPPLIGWTAGFTGALAPMDPQGWGSLKLPGGWLLFILMFAWQIPHFLAIAWMYREDYARGGYRMLPQTDPTGIKTRTNILFWSIALIPVTMAPAFILHDRLSLVSGIAAGLSGLVFLGLCVRLVRNQTDAHARSVFLASIMHLPLLLLVMVGDALANRWW